MLEWLKACCVGRRRTSVTVSFAKTVLHYSIDHSVLKISQNDFVVGKVREFSNAYFLDAVVK